MIWVIYALVDPRELDHYRYIGQTRQSLKIRLSQHEFNGVQKVYEWINELKKQGIRPIILSLVECSSQEDANVTEEIWIQQSWQNGMQLLNTQTGSYYPKLENLKYTKPVPIITSTGLRFNSIIEAANHFNASPLKISRAVNRGTYYPEFEDTQFRFEDKVFPAQRKFYILDSNGSVFASVFDAAKMHNLIESAVVTAIETHLNVPDTMLYFFDVLLKKDGKRNLGFMRKIISSDGRNFLSVQDTANFYEVSRKRIYASLKKGYSALDLDLNFFYSGEDKIQKKERTTCGGHSAKRIFDQEGNYFDSIKEAAVFWNVKTTTIVNSIKLNKIVKQKLQFFSDQQYSLDGKEQGIKIKVKDGRIFNSISQAIKEMKKSYETIKKMIESGEIVKL